VSGSEERQSQDATRVSGSEEGQSQEATRVPGSEEGQSQEATRVSGSQDGQSQGATRVSGSEERQSQEAEERRSVGGVSLLSQEPTENPGSAASAQILESRPNIQPGPSSVSTSQFISPQQFRGFPRAEQKKEGRKGKEKGRSIIATDTPEKNRLEIKQSKRKIKPISFPRAKKERIYLWNGKMISPMI